MGDWYEFQAAEVVVAASETTTAVLEATSEVVEESAEPLSAGVALYAVCQ